MKSLVAKTGIFLGIVFLVGAIAEVCEVLVNHHPLMYALTHPYFITCVLICLLMFASARWQALAWLQPVLYLICAVIAIVWGDYASFYGLGFFSIGILFLFRMGAFEKHRVPKFLLTLLVFYAAEIISAINKQMALFEAVMPLFFITVFLLMLYFAFQEKLMVYLKEPKEKYSLDAKGLSNAEKLYVRELCDGKTYKEIAFTHKVTESTVRNTIARAYHKLGVSDRAGLFDLSSNHELVD